MLRLSPEKYASYKEYIGQHDPDLLIWLTSLLNRDLLLAIDDAPYFKPIIGKFSQQPSQKSLEDMRKKPFKSLPPSSSNQQH